MRSLLDRLTRRLKVSTTPRSPAIWIDLFGKQACAPHDLPATVRRIDQFAEQEKCRITLVLVQRPSDRAGHALHPRHATLRAVESPDDRGKLFLKESRALTRQQGVIITGDADLEKLLAPSGVPLMRYSTFEKALNLAAQNPTADAPSGDQRRHSDHRPPRPSHPPHRPNPHRSSDPAPQKPSSPNRQHAVLDLIDPL